MYVAWLGQSCFALAFGGAAQNPLAQNVVRAAASASSYASHDDDAAGVGGGATASTVAGGGARSDVYSLPSSVSSALPGTRRPRASCAGSCRAAIHAYRSTMCEASRIGRTSRMNASCSESGRLSWWSPHANSVSQIGRPNSWCTSSRYWCSRVASQMWCTAITVTLQPDGPYIAVQLPNHSRNHVRPSPAVAGVMSVESGKSRITCDHARATVAASLLQLWRLFGSLKPSMKLVSTYAGGVFTSAEMPSASARSAAGWCCCT